MNGVEIERLAYDPWGKRRNVNGLSDNADALVGVNTDRGYTMHEHLDEVGVIHMNGRVYDPLIGRFMSADPFIQSPGNLQSYNRYAYVMNNPLAFTDPSGYLSLGSIFRSVGRLVDDVRRGLVKASGTVINAVLEPLPASLRGVAIGAASVAVCGPAAPACAAMMTASAVGSSAYANGASGMDAARAGALAGGTAIAFSYAGDLYANNPAAGYVAHAGVGCVSSVASGGNCAQGAAAAVFGKYATVTVGNYFNTPPAQFNGYQMAATMVAGGVGSVIAGGKFENGAATAAFGYLFNQLGGHGGKGGAKQPGFGYEYPGDIDHAFAPTNEFKDRFFQSPAERDVWFRTQEIASGNAEVREWLRYDDPKVHLPRSGGPLYQIFDLGQTNAGALRIAYSPKVPNVFYVSLDHYQATSAQPNRWTRFEAAPSK